MSNKGQIIVAINHSTNFRKRVNYIIKIIDTEIGILKKVRNSGQLNVLDSTFNRLVKSNVNHDTHVWAKAKKLLFTKLENSLKKFENKKITRAILKNLLMTK